MEMPSPSQNEDDVEITTMENIPKSLWVVDKITDITDKSDGKGAMVTVRVSNDIGRKGFVSERITYEDCGQYFPTLLVNRLTNFALERKEFVEYVERSDFEANTCLTQIIKERRWSNKVRDCLCNHSIGAGWKKFDQPAYFQAGARFFGVRCFGCKKEIVAAAPKTGQHKAGSGVFICEVEATESCRAALCLHCFNTRFSNEERPTRKRSQRAYL